MRVLLRKKKKKYEKSSIYSIFTGNLNLKNIITIISLNVYMSLDGNIIFFFQRECDVSHNIIGIN